MKASLLLLPLIIFLHADAGSYTNHPSVFPPSRYYHSYNPTIDRPKGDIHRYFTFGGNSHNGRPYSTSVQTDSNSGQEAWGGTFMRYQNGYMRPDSMEGSYPTYQYNVRPPVPYKSFYYSKLTDKSKHKKPTVMSYPFAYKKSLYPRAHAPHTMYKYPTKKAVHSYYRRYYQYAMPSAYMLRSKVQPVHTNVVSTPEPPTAATTENVNDYSIASGYYTNYNDTNVHSYYNGYQEQTTVEPSTYEETTTVGYHGDRVYMSTLVPSLEQEKGFRHRLYVARIEPEVDDGLGTFFDM